ncbi:hypothetical protein [Qipengyuania sp. ASV99]|uniref:hypothetical protein n=1 Tax=Qipengyuania sp. ASV99 TaxID=3399681 RepID=UPI003A4C59F7
MTKAILPILTSGLVAALLAGCAQSSDKYPSLAIRPAERVGAPMTAPTPAPTTSAQAFERIKAAAEAARAVHQQFIARQPDALRRAQAARGLGMDDNRRAAAEIALSDLKSLHGQTALSLSDLDRLEFESASTFAATNDINAAQALVGEILSRQTALMDAVAKEFQR